MQIYKTVLSETKQLENVKCNFCGSEISINDFGMLDDYIHVEKNWGYHSSYDGENVSFDICQQCYEKLKSNMAIKPDSSIS